MDSTEDTMQFAVGEHVVYPLQGVGVITRIEEQDFRGVDTMYYVIYLDISDMTVMIPVGKSKELGIRGIVAKGEAQKAIDSISSKYEPMPVDWKARYQMNVDLLMRLLIDETAISLGKEKKEIEMIVFSRLEK